MAKGSRHKARMAAVQALYQWEMTEQSPDMIEDHFIHDHDLSDTDLDYFHHLVREVPLHLHELDDHFQAHIGRDLESVDPVELAILRMATYEMEFELSVPCKVILDEAVELAKTFGSEHSYKFINGVLDKVAVKLRARELAR
jgi:N utilization substance protein B